MYVCTAPLIHVYSLICGTDGRAAAGLCALGVLQHLQDRQAVVSTKAAGQVSG